MDKIKLCAFVYLNFDNLIIIFRSEYVKLLIR